MRQNYLARLLGVDETTLSRMVNGFREPALELQAKIAAVLHSDQEWLFEKAGDITSVQTVFENPQSVSDEESEDADPGGPL